MSDWKKGLAASYGSLARRAFEKELDFRKPGISEEVVRIAREEAGPHNVEIWWRGYTREIISRYQDRVMYWSIGAFAAGFVATRLAEQFGWLQ